MSKTNVLKAMAEALKRGGIKTAYNFPGFNSHKLFDYLDGSITSTNEKIAYELAWGSSQAGRPALVTFKNVGLNDAADPFINSMLTGSGSGLVLTVFDDIELEGSQCILDSRHYFGFYGGLWLEPFDYNSAVVLAEAAPQLSRIFDIPVVIRLTNRTIRFEEKDAQSFISAERIVELADTLAGKRFDVMQVEPLVHPVNGDTHRKLIAAKNETIQQFVDELHQLINLEGVKGKVYCDYSEPLADSHIVTLPVPSNGIGEISAVYEVGDAFIAKELELCITTTKLTSHTVGYNAKNADHYIITPRYERLFRLLKPHYDYITGDLGEYTRDTLQTLTHCLCFGSAISAATGMLEAGKKALAITGDASFYHSSKNAITEAMLRNIPIKVVLIDNGGSQGSGGQKIPGIMPKNVAVIEIDFDTASDTELKEAVSAFVYDSGAMILKVNHKV
jgi:TPP-dependent indolepyruvate ferredoxin oxidoreductase alpha subunit